jgi:hypothetical protein
MVLLVQKEFCLLLKCTGTGICVDSVTTPHATVMVSICVALNDEDPTAFTPFLTGNTEAHCLRFIEDDPLTQ